jgi:PAS domain S-box-containing protein
MSTSIDPDAVLDAIGDALIVSDAAGNVVLWNAGAERLFGWAEAEAMGRRMDMIIPDKSMATGQTRYAHDVLRVPAVDKSGRALSIAFTVFMLFGADGKVSACGSVIRDETDRFAQDRALRKRVAELEAQVAAGAAKP